MRYAQIRKLDISNGENIGVALFVQGCHLHCFNCFNPETWNFDGGETWTTEVKEKFLRLADKPYVKRISILGGEPLAEENLDDVLNLVLEINMRYNMTPQDIDNVKEYKHYMLHNDVNKIRLSRPRKSIWLYTGYEVYLDYYGGKKVLSARMDACTLDAALPTVLREKIIEYCDIVVDGRYIDSQRDISLPYRGSANQKIIDVQQTIRKGEMVLWQT